MLNDMSLGLVGVEVSRPSHEYSRINFMVFFGVPGTKRVSFDSGAKMFQAIGLLTTYR